MNRLESMGLAMLCLSFVTACSPAEPRHLLLVSVNTLRADHLGFHGYARDTSPSMDALAGQGVVFENAWVQWPKTTPSMVSMFSATYPHENGIVVEARPQWVPDEMLLLPEALRDLGFRTAGVSANAVLGRESNFLQGFEAFREMWMEAGGPERREARRVTDIALEELESLADTGERLFLWVHYIDPHQYSPPPGYAEPFLADDLFRSERVAVKPGRVTYKGMRIATPVELRSLAPKVLDALGVAPENNPFAAASLMPAVRSGDVSSLPEIIFTESGGAHTYIHATYTIAARKGAMKLVLPRSDWARERHRGREIELYDLHADPTEERDLAPKLRDYANALRAEIHAWLIEKPAIPPGMGRGANPEYRRETQPNLRALGYLE